MTLRTTTCENDESKIPSAASFDAFSQITTDYSSAFSDYSCFVKEITEPAKLGVGKGVLDIFGLCFDDDCSVLADYHAERKDVDQKWEPWRATLDGGAFRGQRQFTCTTPVKAMMGKPYAFIEYQRYAFLKIDGVLTLILQFSSQVPGVMFGDAFRAESVGVFTQSGSGESAEVTMRAYGYVQFMRNVWVKGRILSTTLDNELPEGYKMLKRLITAAVNRKQTVVTALATPVEAAGDAESVGSGVVSVERAQPWLERSVMINGTVGTVLFVLVNSMKGFVGLWTQSGLQSSHFHRPSGVSLSENVSFDCPVLHRNDSLLSFIRPALVSVYLCIILIFFGVACHLLRIY